MLSPSFYLTVVVAWNAIAGLAIAPVNPIISTTMQERIPPAMRARVFGTLDAGYLAGIPLGTFAIGYVVAWLGLEVTLVLMGAIYLLSTLSLLVNPAMKKMNRTGW